MLIRCRRRRYRESEAAKKEEAARKKAEREALLAEEEKNTPGRAAPKNAKTAQKKSRGLDLSQLDGGDGPLGALNASGIDNALDALSITNTDNNAKIDRHPERRKNAAWLQFREERMEQLQKEGYFKLKGNNRSRVLEDLRDEFEKSPENPMNQVQASYNATQEELAEIRAQEKAKVELRLGEKK